MNKVLITVGLFFTIIFSGCSSYSITKYFNKDDFFLKALQETKKSDILKNNEVKVIFTATYLNRVSKEYENNFENFIISVYETEEKNTKLNVSLNETVASEITSIKKESNLLKSLPLKNTWAKYYLVKFNKIEDSENLNLKYFSQDNEEVSLSFQK